MRRGNAKHCRAARKRTLARHRGARGLGPRAFPAQRRTYCARALARAQDAEPSQLAIALVEDLLETGDFHS